MNKQQQASFILYTFLTVIIFSLIFSVFNTEINDKEFITELNTYYTDSLNDSTKKVLYKQYQEREKKVSKEHYQSDQEVFKKIKEIFYN